LVFDMPERKSFMYRQFDWGVSRIKIPHSKKAPEPFFGSCGRAEVLQTPGIPDAASNPVVAAQ